MYDAVDLLQLSENPRYQRNGLRRPDLQSLLRDSAAVLNVPLQVFCGLVHDLKVLGREV
jgi:hypothetical protein